MKASEAWVLAQVESVKGSNEHIGSSNFIFPLDPSQLVLESTGAASDPIVVALLLTLQLT